MFKIFGADARKAHPFLMSLAESFRNRKKSAIELDRFCMWEEVLIRFSLGQGLLPHQTEF